MKTILIIDVIGSRNAILHSFGLQVFNEIKPYLSSNQLVTLSFEGIKNVTSGFCNASIGKAYLEFPHAGELISISGIKDNLLWKEKKEDAIIHASYPEKIKMQDQAISELFCS